MRWSVRIAVLFMLAAWLLMIRRPNKDAAARWFWTAGFAAYLIHLWAAFEFVHHWSHTDAIAATAKQTKDLVGLDWGGGVWANHLFTVVWGADVLWWWMSLKSRRSRPGWLNWFVHGFLGFIAFNATVVFASGLSRWMGVAGCVLLLSQWRAARRQPAVNSNAKS
jgi:hypothetical protein